MPPHPRAYPQAQLTRESQRVRKWRVEADAFLHEVRLLQQRMRDAAVERLAGGAASGRAVAPKGGAAGAAGGSWLTGDEAVDLLQTSDRRLELIAAEVRKQGRQVQPFTHVGFSAGIRS